MKQYKVFLTGCARNNGRDLEAAFEKLLEIRSLFSDESVICIIENDSTDETGRLLDEFKATNENVLVYHFEGLSAKKPSRTDRLAFCRNFAANLALTKYANFDFFIAADLDNVLTAQTVTAIPKCLQLGVAWDALFANSLPKYYDVWALRSKQLGLRYDCWDAITHDCQGGLRSFVDAKQVHVRRFQQYIDPTAPLIEVESAFNGLGIYRMAALRGCVYKGVTQSCSYAATAAAAGPCKYECCEHVSFHAGMVAAGRKLFIAPFLLVNAQMEHL